MEKEVEVECGRGSGVNDLIDMKRETGPLFIRRQKRVPSHVHNKENRSYGKQSDHDFEFKVEQSLPKTLTRRTPFEKRVIEVYSGY